MVSRKLADSLPMPLLDSVKSFVQSTTEQKVRQATDESENSGATGTLMNEISVLTYSPKTLKEIIQVIRKRLTGNGRKNSHKNCIHLVKTLTLVSYLMNNGSNDFIAWVRSSIFVIECLTNFQAQDRSDEQIGKQIRLISNDLCALIKDDTLLEQRRKDVGAFRSSISSPGRKSTDNSHLKKWSSGASANTDPPKSSLSMSPIAVGAYQFTSNTTNYYQRGITSLDLKRRVVPKSHDSDPYALTPLREEDDNHTTASQVTTSYNPFR